MSEQEGGGGGSPSSTDNQVEGKEPAASDSSNQQEMTGLTTEDGEVIPPGAPKARAKKVAMINGRKLGRVFPSKDIGYGPGETYHCTEATAKKMEKIPGQRRV